MFGNFTIFCEIGKAEFPVNIFFLETCNYLGSLFWAELINSLPVPVIQNQLIGRLN